MSGLANQWFVRVIDSAARAARKRPRRMQIILVGDKKMLQLNAAYRKKNRTTDVLSFPANAAPLQAKKLGYSPARDDDGYLGEIVLSVPQLRRQAREYSVSFKREAARVIIHGFLHLWGYDHIKSKDARMMLLLQEKILRNFGNSL